MNDTSTSTSFMHSLLSLGPQAPSTGSLESLRLSSDVMIVEGIWIWKVETGARVDPRPEEASLLQDRS